MWREALNGTVALLGSASFDTLIRIAGTFSVISVLIFYMKGRDITGFLRWLVVFFIITIVCLVPKRPVQIIDVSNRAGVYEVDNVPVVLGFVSSFATTAGYAVASKFDQDISLPDALEYSKTGMTFGADLVVAQRDVPSYSFPLSDNLVAYMNKCAVPAMLINNTYHAHDILEAEDISQVIFQNPSQIANMPYTDGNGNVTLVTCDAGAAQIQKALASPAITFQAEIQKWTQRVFGSSVTGNADMQNDIQDTTQFFYGVGKSQTDILKKRIFQSAVDRSLSTLAAEDRNDSMAEIIAEQQTAMKTNMQGKVEQHIGARYMPLIHSMLELILVCIFPLVVVIALISHEAFGLRTLMIYAGGWLYLQMWPIMFSLVNFVAVYSLRAHTLSLGGGDSLAARFESAGYYSDMAAVAGYMCLGAIPVLSYFITKGAAAVGSQVVGAVTGGAALASGASASLAEDGNWSFNNLSQDNVSANKWNTNVDHREGMTTTQLGNGGLTSTTSDGSHVLDNSGAMSKLPANINWSSMMSSQLTEGARQAETQASSHLKGFNHATDTAFSQMNDLSHGTSRSNMASHGSESSESVSQSQTASHVMDMAHSYAQKWGVTDKEAFNKMMSESNSDRYHADAGVQASAGLEVAGTGGSLKAGAGVSTDRGYQDTGVTAKGSDRTSDHSHDMTAADRKDFRESLDSLKQDRNYSGGNTADTQTDGRSNRLESSLRTADSEYSQYTNSMTKANELSQQAQKAQTDSAGFNANMNQDFVNWARQRGATDEQLMDVNSQAPMAAEYARERFGSNIEAGYEQNVRQAMGQPVGKALAGNGDSLGENFSPSGNRNPGEVQSVYPSQGQHEGQSTQHSVSHSESANRTHNVAQEPSGRSASPSEGSRQSQNFSDNNARLNAAAQGRDIPAAVGEPRQLNTTASGAAGAQKNEIEQQMETLKNSSELRQRGFGQQYENHKEANKELTLKVPTMADAKKGLEDAKRYAGYKK